MKSAAGIGGVAPLRATPGPERAHRSLRRSRRDHGGLSGYLPSGNGIFWWFDGIFWWFDGILWWFNEIFWWFNGIFWWFDGILWWFTGIYGGLMGLNGIYHLENVDITMENHHFLWVNQL